MKQVNNFPFSDNIVDSKQTDNKPNQSNENNHCPDQLQKKESDPLNAMNTDSKETLNQGLDNASVEEEDNELPVTFLDRVIAFLVLIVPFCVIIPWTQDQIDFYFPDLQKSIANMVVLVGIIVFLLAVGRLSKIIYGYRLKFFPR